MTETLNSILAGKTPLRSQDLRLSNEDGGIRAQKIENEDKIQLIKEQKGLWRLNSVLSSEKPLKENVPRGYYLNITV